MYNTTKRCVFLAALERIFFPVKINCGCCVKGWNRNASWAWNSQMQLGILKRLDTDEKLIVSLWQKSLCVLIKWLCPVLFSATVMSKAQRCQSRTVLLVVEPLMSSVSKRQPGIHPTEPKDVFRKILHAKTDVTYTKGSLSLPCALLCWASEGSGRGQRSCDWSRCRWATASCLWHTGSRLSAPDPRRMGLVVDGMGVRRRQGRKRTEEQ